MKVLESFFRNNSQLTGVRNVSSRVTSWTSDNPSVISVSSHGLATALASTGTANITAAVKAPGWGAQLSIQLTAAAPTLQFITLTPFNSSLALNTSQLYTATPHYSDGTTTPLDSNPWSWSVNPISSGTFAACASTTCQFTANATTPGVAVISVTYNGVTGSTFLNIGLTGITIAPLNPPANPPSVPKGMQQTFSAMGTFSDGSSTDVTNSVRWISGTTTVARITSGIAGCGACAGGGIASTLAIGTSQISAASGSVSSTSLTLTVTAPVVTSVTISVPGCDPANVPRGISCQFTAVAKYSDQTTATVTNSATWSSDNANCASVNATGLATTLSSVPNPCSANISASFSSVSSNSIGLTVTTHVLTSISVSPDNPIQPKGNTQQFKVRAHYTDGTVTVANGASGPTWSSSNTSVATIGSSSGLANTTNSITGTTNIGASYGGFFAYTPFTVTAAALKSIAVTTNRVPLTPDDGSTTVPIAATQQFTATGTYTDNSTQVITNIVTWSSSDLTVATISDPNAPGLATGVAASPSFGITITATDPNNLTIFGTATLVVKAINSITVSPASVMLNPGETQQFTATANYPGPATQPLSAFGPAWLSNHANVATVNQNGLVTAISQGPVATITATLGSVSCPTNGGTCGAVTVNAAILQSITVSCDPTTPCTGTGEPLLQLGQTEQMIATGNYSDGSTRDLTQSTGMTWTSTNTSVATIGTTTGFLTTAGLGSTTLRATCSTSCPGAQSTVQGSLVMTVSF